MLFVCGFVNYMGKEGLIMLFYPILGNFWCSVLTSVTFSSKVNIKIKKYCVKYLNEIIKKNSAYGRHQLY